MRTHPYPNAPAGLAGSGAAAVLRPATSVPRGRSLFVFLFALASLIWLTATGHAGPLGDYGDAPNSALAYPSKGVLGNFPTCTGNAVGFVGHLTAHNEVRFGPSVDFENDGNGGVCGWPPYDNDECFGPPDAGLILPDAYTVNASLNEVTCSGAPGRPLGPPCTTAIWGPTGNIDIEVTNLWPSVMYVNLLIDWNQNGNWSGFAPCTFGPAVEHVLQNFPVPAGYSGPLSALGPPSFLIGPKTGLVWARFTIGEVGVPAGWTGAHVFDLGETEDYLLRIGATGGGGVLGDYGDAPNGALAYSSPATIGQFPTCVGGATGVVVHGAASNVVRFGPSVDFETDGNGGSCAWPAYDNDECFGPPDAGLMFPDGYTINAANVEVTCSGGPGRPLGLPCTTAFWGGATGNLDIEVTNASPSTMYANVLIDWNGDGSWGGAAPCVSGPAPEHVLIDFPVPSGFSGPLSALAPPSFQIGPNVGFAWARLTIGEVPVGVAWAGAHFFDLGETEDYLLRIGATGGGGVLGDYGDAPEGALAYPATAVVGRFPTCVGGIPGFVAHVAASNVVHFGPSVDFETDGNGGTCVWPAYDNDECFGPPDAGLIAPDGYTINTASVEETCAGGPGRPLGPPCTMAIWGGVGGNIDIRVNNGSTATMYVNVLIDWDGDGVWGGAGACPSGATPEHVLVDFLVPGGFSGPLSALAPPSFRIGPNVGFAWARFTIGEAPVGVGWTGAHVFDLGETEDYLLRIGNAAADVPLTTRTIGVGLELEPARPNPVQSGSVIALRLDRPAKVRLTVNDASGRAVALLLDGELSAGRHQAVWNGRGDGGRALPPGTYFMRAQSGSLIRTQKVTLLK